jgi:hypothetical protein
VLACLSWSWSYHPQRTGRIGALLQCHIYKLLHNTETSIDTPSPIANTCQLHGNLWPSSIGLPLHVQCTGWRARSLAFARDFSSTATREGRGPVQPIMATTKTTFKTTSPPPRVCGTDTWSGTLLCCINTASCEPRISIFVPLFDSGKPMKRYGH